MGRLPYSPDIWILSEQSQPYLELAREHTGAEPQLVGKLRKYLTAAQTSEVVQQNLLRRRALKKFSQAWQMFFTDKGLQQATDERTARYKSVQFPSGPLLDLGCGLGGDLLALAARQVAVGIEPDQRCALYAARNCQVLGVLATIIRTRAEHIALADVAAWHADPDRRAYHRRSSRVEWSEPGPETLERALHDNPHAGIKLAPAAQLSPAWSDRAEAEWIGEQDECRQLFLRFGRLTGTPGVRTATLLDADGGVAGQVRGPAVPPQITARVQRLVFEPHACVRAAGLTDTLAARHGLQRISATAPYLTGDHPIADGLLAAFLVVDAMPFDLRRLKQAIRQRGWGRLEIKKRGSDVRPEQLQQKLRVPGSGQGVVLLSPRGRGMDAILAQRWPGSFTDGRGELNL